MCLKTWNQFKLIRIEDYHCAYFGTSLDRRNQFLHTYIHDCTHSHTHAHTYLHTHTHTDMYSHTHTYKHKCTCIHKSSCTPKNDHTVIHTNAHTCILTHIHSLTRWITQGKGIMIKIRKWSDITQTPGWLGQRQRDSGRLWQKVHYCAYNSPAPHHTTPWWPPLAEGKNQFLLSHD